MVSCIFIWTLQKEFLRKHKLYRLFRRRFFVNEKFTYFKDKSCRVYFLSEFMV